MGGGANPKKPLNRDTSGANNPAGGNGGFGVGLHSNVVGPACSAGVFGENFMIIAQVVNETTQTVTQTGIGLGSAIAVVLSWQRNRSILWAILAGIFSWFYVIYFAATRQPDETK